MEQFPSNSRRPPRARDEPKKIERVVTGDVVRRKTPLSRRMSQNLIGGDVQSVWGYVIGDVLIPAARDMVADASSSFVERLLFGEAHRGGRSRSRGGHVAYNRYSAPSGGRPRDEPRREISRRARANHSFDEVILSTRVEATEVLDRLDDLIEKYDSVSVADLYGMCDISANYTDDRWGWTDLRSAGISHVRNGYLLNLPKPEPLD